jgi:hypothetical protein
MAFAVLSVLNGDFMPETSYVVSTVEHPMGIRSKDWLNLSLQFKHCSRPEYPPQEAWKVGRRWNYFDPSRSWRKMLNFCIVTKKRFGGFRNENN